MKGNLFANRVQTSHFIRLQAQNQTRGFHGSGDAAARGALALLHHGPAWDWGLVWGLAYAGRGRASPDGGWLLDQLS